MRLPRFKNSFACLLCVVLLATSVSAQTIINPNGLSGSTSNIAGGVSNNIPYQTGPGTTGFIAPVNNSVLTTNGSGVPSENTSLTLAGTITGGNLISSSPATSASAGQAQVLGGCSIVAANSIDIGASCSPGQLVTITGNTTINTLGSTALSGSHYILYFTGTPTITNGANLLLPNSTNITMVATTTLLCYVPATAGTWYCSNALYNQAAAIAPNGAISNSAVSTQRVSVTGSTIPTNGIYLPGTSQVGFATAAAAAGLIDKNQGWVASGGTATIVSGDCGATSNGSVSGSNNRGQVTIGASATTSCKVTFGAAYTAAPYCMVFPANSASALATINPYISASAVGSFTFANAGVTALTSTAWNYICL